MVLGLIQPLKLVKSQTLASGMQAGTCSSEVVQNHNARFLHLLMLMGLITVTVTHDALLLSHKIVSQSTFISGKSTLPRFYCNKFIFFRSYSQFAMI
jgi:hypothetical protein